MRTSFFLGGLLCTGVAIGAGCGGGVIADGTGGAGTGAGSTSGAGGTSTSAGGTGGAGGTSGTGGAGGGLAPGQCRTMNDCNGSMQFEECLPPGASPGCGICFSPPTTCESDADCAAQGPAAICVSPPCACPDVQTCVQGCTEDAMCGAGETCGPTHRCEPEACASTSDCPTNFGCSGGACQRLTCAVDATCSGYCVDGLCYDTPGTCTAPAA